MDDKAFLSTVDSLRQIFTIVLALSLGEAFKQFVVDSKPRTQGGEGEPILWQRLMALVAFLLLLVPFYQGMARYLFQEYQSGTRPQPYGVFLLIDCVLFTLEASLFFVMSRALDILNWRRFYGSVLIVLSADAAWGTFVWLSHKWPYRDPAILRWLILDFVSVPVFALILLRFRTAGSKWGPRLALAAMAVRTVADYWTSWPLYFPQ